MRLRRALLASFAGLLLAGGASAQLKDENLLQGMPAGYKIGFQERQGPIIITEMVPESESAEEWTEMVTSQLFIGQNCGNCLPEFKMMTKGHSG